MIVVPPPTSMPGHLREKFDELKSPSAVCRLLKPWISSPPPSPEPLARSAAAAESSASSSLTNRCTASLMLYQRVIGLPPGDYHSNEPDVSSRTMPSRFCALGTMGVSTRG